MAVLLYGVLTKKNVGWKSDGVLKTHIICMCLLKSYVVSKSNLLRKFVSGVNWDRNLEKAVSRLFTL